MKNLPVIALFFAFVLGCGQMEKPVVNSNEPPVTVSAAELTRAYSENEIAADDKYRNRRLEVSGKITEISETLGSLQVDLEGHKENELNLMTVKCVFNESEKANIAKLKKGQQVSFQGTGDGLTAGLYVGLNDCRIN